jgi:hypothetical protein
VAQPNRFDRGIESRNSARFARKRVSLSPTARAPWGQPLCRASNRYRTRQIPALRKDRARLSVGGKIWPGSVGRYCLPGVVMKYPHPHGRFYESPDLGVAPRIGKPPPQGRAWLLALDGDWIPECNGWTTVCLSRALQETNPACQVLHSLLTTAQQLDWCAWAPPQVARWRTENWKGAGPIPCWRITCQGASCKAPAWLPQLRREATP